MNVGSVLIAHPSPDLYGSDRVLLETVSGFVQSGHEVVVAIPGNGPLSAALHERGARVEHIAFPVLRKSLLAPKRLLHLLRDVLQCLPTMMTLIRRVRPSLTVVNTITIPFWILASRLCRVPVICHVHEAEQSAKPIVKRLLYLPLLACTGLVVNSQFSLNVLTDTWPRVARFARVVYNGVPGPRHPVRPRAILEGPIRLLFLGRLSPRKGPQVAIEAARLLVADGLDVSLGLLGAVFPGYEWFESELVERVQGSGLSERVEFLGFDPDVWSQLAACDIVLVPSTVDEPFGNTAVEAMLALRPLVVSATSGLKEASAGYATAQQVTPGDASALASAVVELVGHWRGIVENGPRDRQRALERHAPAVYQTQIVSVINELLNGRGSAK